MKISINIPSFKRFTRLDTLEWLPFANLWVCETEVNTYRKIYPAANYKPIKKGVQGNLARVKNYILDNCDDDCVCIIDDDVSGIFYREDGKRKCPVTTEGMMDFLQKYSLQAEELGVHLWGVNVNDDRQSYREYIPFSMLSYIGGPVSCHVKSDIRYDERFALKQDYDLTLQHLNKYRKVFRLNKFYYRAKMGASGTGQVGGCAVYRNHETEVEAFELLQKKWGKKIVQQDKRSRSHNSSKVKKVDINPVIRVPISGV